MLQKGMGTERGLHCRRAHCHTHATPSSVSHTCCLFFGVPAPLQSLLQMCGELSTSDHRAARCPADLRERLLGLISTSAQGRRWHTLAQSHYLAEGSLLHQEKRCTNRSVRQQSRGKLCHNGLDERQSPRSEDKRAQHTAHRDLHRIAAEHKGEAALW